jgi:hypothetical protein
MSQVGDLFAALGVRVDRESFVRADAALDRTKAKVDGIYQDTAGRWRAAHGRFLSSGERAASGVANAHESAAGRMRRAHSDSTNAAIAGLSRLGQAAAAYFTLRAGYSALIKSNADREDIRTNIAGAISLAKKTDFRAEVGTAQTLIDNLARRAASLPGTTSEYVQMLGMITQPILDAKLGMQDLEDLTVNATVAAKGLHIDWQVAARDIDQALRGQFHSTDQFAGKVLGSIGFTGEEGRTKFNALSADKRAAELKRALMQQQFTDMAEAAGSGFSGMIATLQDTAENFGRSVGKPLFEGVKGALRDANAWFSKYKDTIEEVAAVVGTVLGEAFELVGSAIAQVVEVMSPHRGLLLEVFGAVLHDALIVTKGLIDAIGIAFDFVVEHAAAMKVVAAAIALPLAPFIALLYLIHKVINAFSLMDVARSVADSIAGAFSWLGDQVAGVWESVTDALSGFMGRIVSGFWETGDGIKKAFADAYDYVTSLDWIDAIPVIGRIKKAVTGPSVWEQAEQALSAGGPRIPAGGAGGIGGDTNIKIGDVNVSSPNADPKMVAIEVRRELGNVLRETRDAL